MRARKASGPGARSAHRARRGDLLGRRIGAEARLPQHTLQAVYDGQGCIGNVLLRGRGGFEAFHADDISLDRAYAEMISDRLRDRAADSTVEALMFSLRSGLAALGKPDALRRLSQCSDEQARAVAVRVQKFKPEIAPAWTLENVEVLLVAWSKIHGQDT